MKTKNIIILISLFMTLNFFGQTEKGHFLISGSTNLSFTTTTTSTNESNTDYKNTNINFTPIVGYFISEDVSLGLLVTYQGSFNEHVDQTSFVAGPFLRYYFAKSDKLFPFAQTAVFFGSNSVNYDYSSNESKISTDMFGYELDLGLGILLSKQVSFDIILGYAHAKESVPVSKTKTRDVTTGAFGVSLGLSLYLGK